MGKENISLRMVSKIVEKLQLIVKKMKSSLGVDRCEKPPKLAERLQ